MQLKYLAKLIAEASGKKVVYEMPDAMEASGYSKATKARLDGTKLRKLGWTPRFNIEKGIIRVLTILREIQ